MRTMVEPHSSGTTLPRVYTGRQVASLSIALLGAAFMATGLLVNPWLGRLWYGQEVVNRLTVLRSYCAVSLLAGALVLLLGIALARRERPVLDALAFPAVWLAAVVILDRFLLVVFGLTLWTFDLELHYRHRPGIERTLSSHGRPDARVRINRWGHHDTEFSERKAEGELRGLLLGDSVTMGFGLPYEETFAAELERILAERAGEHGSYEIINAGVHGYATFQERIALERSWRFEPDFVAVGFCLNDVTEPLIVNRDLGGVGIDYHGVFQARSALFGWFANETGFGRLVQQIAARRERVEHERLQELHDVRRMAEDTSRGPGVSEAWARTLRELERIYAEARQRDVEVVLMIFPFTFQLRDESLRAPQQLLREHARTQGVDTIDLTQPFARLVYSDPEVVAALTTAGYGEAEIERFYRWKVERYFFDQDHLTAEGHRVTAEALAEWMRTRGLVAGLRDGSAPITRGRPEGAG